MIREDYFEIVDTVGIIIDFTGVVIIAVGIIIALSIYFQSLLSRKKSLPNPYNVLRFNLARTILLGLEFLVAGDIIRSIATPLTFSTVIILGLIVLIRFFLSWEFEKRTNGYFKLEKEQILKGQ